MIPAGASSRRQRHAGRFPVTLIGALVMVMTATAHGAVITVVNTDGPAVGMNDPTPRAPVGGNPGTTLGQQRFHALQHAADLWGAVLDSDVEIVVAAQFDLFDVEQCTASSAVLGFASPTAAFSDFDGAARAATLYGSALADSLAGMDLNPGLPDIVATFNARLDLGCFNLGAPNGWYYGFDGNVGFGRIDIIQTALHELGHGLGFATFVNLRTGVRCCGAQPEEQLDDAFMTRLEDHSTQLLWPEMTDAERAASATNANQLHWVGPNVANESAQLSSGRAGTHVRLYAPAELRPGSSVSHFDTSLSPDELMEPFLIFGAPRELAIAALKDIGWRLIGDPTPTATLSPSITATPLPTSSPSATATATDSPSPSVSPTPTPTATPTASGTSTATATTTPTASPTRTPTISPTATATRSATATPTLSPTRSPTASPTTTASATPTRTPTATRTSTPTRSATPSRTSTPTRTPPPTATEADTPTPTSSPSAPPSATATPIPAPFCAADCDGDRRVAIGELQRGVAIFLMEIDVTACPAADLDASATVDITELQKAAAGFLVGCESANSG